MTVPKMSETFKDRGSLEERIKEFCKKAPHVNVFERDMKAGEAYVDSRNGGATYYIVLDIVKIDCSSTGAKDYKNIEYVVRTDYAEKWVKEVRYYFARDCLLGVERTTVKLDERLTDELVSDVVDKNGVAAVKDLDWRPNETTPEDYYAI